ncbi:Prostaglandin G/H synthase 2 [Blattella germanica]|nr:Prostaglandin G/H synthase 2 [Blattella germanica]
MVQAMGKQLLLWMLQDNFLLISQRKFVLLFTLLCGVKMDEICVHEAAKGRGFDNPCCFYPCENRGVCVQRDQGYLCDCSGLSYFGRHCHRATWGRWMRKMFLPSIERLVSFLNRFPVLWHFVNGVGIVKDIVMQYIYQIFLDAVMLPIMHIDTGNYLSLDAYFNCSAIARDLPPVPFVCPTAMGFRGAMELPPIEKVMEKVLVRGQFRVCLQGTNLLFLACGQYFIRQLKADRLRTTAFTCCNGVIGASQIYGGDENLSRALRCLRDGKLKIETDDTPQWALIDPVFDTNPWLFAVATIWIREHNRVCNVLKTENPGWDDERLYQTARLIITGEMIKVTLSDYLQHLGQYNMAFDYKPDLLHNTNFQYSNRIFEEFLVLLHFQAMEPESFLFHNASFNFQDRFNTVIIAENGLDAFVEMMVTTIAGEVGNVGKPAKTKIVYICSFIYTWGFLKES